MTKEQVKTGVRRIIIIITMDLRKELAEMRDLWWSNIF